MNYKVIYKDNQSLDWLSDDSIISIAKDALSAREFEYHSSLGLSFYINIKDNTTTITVIKRGI